LNLARFLRNEDPQKMLLHHHFGLICLENGRPGELPNFPPSKKKNENGPPEKSNIPNILPQNRSHPTNILQYTPPTIYTYHLQNFIHLFRLAFNLIPAFAKVISPLFFPINISFAIPTLPNSVYDIIPSLSFILRSSAHEYRLLHIHFCFGDWSES